MKQKIFELPSNEEGSMFDIYRTTYRFNPKKDKSITKLFKTDKYIRGFVEDRYLPQEGKVFRMVQFRLVDKLKFGGLKVSKCYNVIEENGCYYFESAEGNYILMPAKLN